ncbi:hypothetical protein [Streptomyces asiaticus]|uniref:hypothetical protein n=1 Tax=Streptomyces asiaticus TaxID=114695 RepID=UPI0037F2E3F4
MDQRVFGPYFGTPPEKRAAPEPPLAPPETLTRTERRAHFAAQTKRLLRRHLQLNR